MKKSVVKLTKRPEAIKCRITPAEFKAMKKRIDEVRKDLKRLTKEIDRLKGVNDDLDYDHDELIEREMMPLGGMMQYAVDEIGSELDGW